VNILMTEYLVINFLNIIEIASKISDCYVKGTKNA
jgi:hypothetical protein